MSARILPRPLALHVPFVRKQRRNALLVTLLVGAVGGFMLWFGVSEARTKWEERRIWTTGTPASEADYDGNVVATSKLGLTIYRTYKLKVRYVDQEGVAHAEPLEFTTLLGEANTDGEPTVRFDPAQPEHFAISISAESGVTGWGFALLATLLGVLGIPGAWVIFRNARDRAAAFAFAVEDGVELLARVTQLTRVQNSRNFNVEVELPDSSGAPQRTTVTVEDPLIVVVRGVNHALVVRSPRAPKVPIVLSERLEPFALTTEAESQVRERLAELSGVSPSVEQAG